jgi:hypothetical protein
MGKIKTSIKLFPKYNQEKYDINLNIILKKYHSLGLSDTNICDFINEMEHCYESLTIQVKKTQLNRNHPWYTPTINIECQLRDKLYKNYLAEKTDKSLLIYKKQKRICNRLLQKAKRDYYERVVSNELSSDPKKSWKALKPLISKSEAQNSKGIPYILFEDIKYENTHDIAELFMQYFKNSVQNVVDSLDYTNMPTKFGEHLEHNMDKFCFTPTEESKVLSAIKKYQAKAPK